MKRWTKAGWVLAATIFMAQSVAYAHTLPMSPAYPNDGYAWLARFDDVSGLVWLISEQCRPWELTAIDAMRNTTSGSRAEFRGAWPNGIAPNRKACSGSVENSTDIVLDYMTPTEWNNSGHGAYGGHEHSSIASVAWCDVYGHPKTNSRCGIHPSRIHLNTDRILGYSSDTVRRNHLIHEISHSFGFLDSCSVDAITNNTGASGCTLPAGFIALDRQELRDHIYPGWRYN